MEEKRKQNNAPIDVDKFVSLWMEAYKDLSITKPLNWIADQMGYSPLTLGRFATSLRRQGVALPNIRHRLTNVDTNKVSELNSLIDEATK